MFDYHLLCQYLCAETFAFWFICYLIHVLLKLSTHCQVMAHSLTVVSYCAFTINFTRRKPHILCSNKSCKFISKIQINLIILWDLGPVS